MSKQLNKPFRKNLRLSDYDYASPGAYFITISTKDRKCLFGDVHSEKIELNDAGKIVRRCWEEIPSHYPLVALDQFIVMPNHIHGLINIDEHAAGDACVAPTQNSARPSLGSIVGSFKSSATKLINILHNSSGTSIWQRGFYEHVIRQNDDMQAIREYIVNNPLRWAIDRENIGKN